MTSISRDIKLIAALVIIVASFIGFRMSLSNRDATQDLKANAEQGVRTDEAAGEIAADAGAIRAEVDQSVTGLEVARSSYFKKAEEARNEDSEVDAWSDAAVPQRLRDLARERREARERLGRDGDGSRRDDEAAPDSR